MTIKQDVKVLFWSWYKMTIEEYKRILEDVVDKVIEVRRTEAELKEARDDLFKCVNSIIKNIIIKR